MSKTQDLPAGRRAVLKGLSFGGLALAASPAAASATGPAKAKGIRPSVPLAPPAMLEVATPAAIGPAQAGAASQTSATGKPLYGSDYMVDVLRGMDINVLAQIPGNTFAGLHESIVNRGMLAEPPMDMLTVTHEEISVAFAHGYAKVTNELSAAIVHSTVGLQHASMAIYNAWCDRAPVLTITGSLTNPDSRKSWVDWLHAVSDGPALTRDFTKFDETPRTLPHFTESLARCYQMAMTPPCGPVVLAVDLDMQERPLVDGEKLPPPRKPRIVPPQGEMGAVREAAAMLAAATSPVIIVDRTARTPAGLKAVVDLAELLSAAVIDMGGRMNFPWQHPLNQSFNRGATLRGADVVLALEVQDMVTASSAARNAKRISISTYDYYLKSNYQTFQSLPSVELAIAGDAEATLPALIEAVRQAIPARARGAIRDRGTGWSDARKTTLSAAREGAAYAWNAKPITTARVWAELYDQVRDKDWALVGGCHFEGKWPQQLWDSKQSHQYIGDSGGYGLGYLPGAAVGAAYAHKAHGRIPIVFGGDGDLLMAPGALFTAAEHKVPLLYMVHNNGGYHQEVMKVQEQANRRNRGVRRAQIGCMLPGQDYSLIARGMGVAAERVTEPGDLRAAIQRALAIVARGEPALLDIVSQGR